MTTDGGGCRVALGRKRPAAAGRDGGEQRATPRRRRMVLVVGAVAASLVLGACGGVVGSFVSTRQALSAAGYSDVSVGVAGNDDNVKISARVDQTISAGEFHEIAAIVWRDVHQRFGALDITLHAAGQTVRQSVSLAELQRQLGPRNPSYNKSSLRTEIITTGVAVLAAIAAVVILLVVAVVLVRRRRRGGRSGSRGQPDPTGSGRGPGHPWPPGGGGPPEGRRRPDRGGGRAAEPSWGTPVPVPAPTPGSEGRVTEPDSWPPPPGSEPPAWS